MFGGRNSPRGGLALINFRYIPRCRTQIRFSYFVPVAYHTITVPVAYHTITVPDAYHCLSCLLLSQSPLLFIHFPYVYGKALRATFNNRSPNPLLS